MATTEEDLGLNSGGDSESSAPSSLRSLPSRLVSVYRENTGPAEQSLLFAWVSFAATFATARGVTHWSKARSGGGGVSVGGRHLHHYNVGIVLLTVVGGIALRGEEKHRRHPATAAAYGSGLALIVDELALLIDLEDVYWAKDGRDSVDAAIGVIAGGGALAAAIPLWKGTARELLRTRLY